MVAGSHLLPCAQSPSLAQLVLQVLAPHANAWQAMDWTPPHCPWPSHVPEVIAIPCAQLGCPQGIPATKPAQRAPSLPSHSAAAQGFVAVPAAHAARAPRGAPEMLTHLPFEPAASHAWH
jgi:hypothetical protein